MKSLNYTRQYFKKVEKPNEEQATVGPDVQDCGKKKTKHQPPQTTAAILKSPETTNMAEK